MRAGDRVETPARQALRGIGIALRSRRMYPASSDISRESLEEAHRRIAVIEGPELRLQIHPDGILLPAENIERSGRLEPTLARRLHELQVGELRIDVRLSRESLEELLALLLDDAAPAALGKRLEGGAVPGVQARTIDLERIFAESGGVIAPGRALWDRLLIDFSAATGAPANWESRADDPEVLTELLRWLGGTDDLAPELSGFSRVDLLSIVAEQATVSAGDDVEAVLRAMAAAAGGAFDTFDPEVWLQFLADPLAIELQTGDDGRPIELGAVMISGLSVEQAARLLEYGLDTRGRVTPRLHGLFGRLVHEHPRGGRIRQRMTEAGGADWTRIERLDEAEQPDPWVGVDYAATLGGPTSPAPGNRSALRPRFAELSPERTRLSAVRIAISMMERERTPAQHEVTSSFVRERLPELLEAREFRLLDEALGALRRQADDSSLPLELVDRAEALLAELSETDLLDDVLAALGMVSGSDFELACRILSHLRADPVPFLLELVAAGSTVCRHEVVRLWRDSAELPVAALERAIRDAEARSARPLTLLAADLGRPEMMPALRAGLEHADADTRRAAVRGLGRLPDELAVDPLLTALTDPALEVRITAVRGLRQRDPASCHDRIASALATRNLTGRNTPTLVAALKATEALRERSLLPAVERLARRPILFHRRRRPVTVTARRVADALRQEPEPVPFDPPVERKAA